MTVGTSTFGAAGDRPLIGRRILVLEDQMLIAMDAVEVLLEAGAAFADSAATVEEGLAFLDRAPPNAAVLDVDLGNGMTSLPVADALQARGIPFIFATGYGEATAAPIRFRAVPVIAKPYTPEVLTAAVAALLPPA